MGDGSMAFCSVRTVQLVGLNPSTPFASIVAAGTLLYLSGSSLLLENTRTKEQRILWTNPHPKTPSLITHTITPHHQHFIAAVIKDPLSPLPNIMVLPLAPASPENPHPVATIYPLPFLQAGEELQDIVFLEEGVLLGRVARKGENWSLLVWRCSSCEPLMVVGFGGPVKMGSVGLGRKRWVVVVVEEGGQVWVRGWALGDLQRKWMHQIRLEREEAVASCAFEPYQEECLLLLLTSTGFVLVFRISEQQISFLTRADVRIHPLAIHQNLRRMVSIATNDPSEARLPSLFKAAGGKIILGYTSPPTLAILSYSSLDPSSTRFTPFPATLALPRANSLLSIAVAPDNCTLSAVLQLTSPSPSRTTLMLPASALDSEGQVIAVQVDLVGNLVEEGGRRESVERSLSAGGGLGKVRASAYCQFHNRLFVVMGWRLACYSLGGGEEVLLWEQALSEPAIGLAVHPFNFVLLLLYPDLLKLHVYTRHGLLPPHLVTNLSNSTQSAFSPLGDKLALATSSSLTFFDSYSLRKLAQYPLPSRPLALSQKSGSERWQLMQFVDNEEVMVVGSGGVSLLGRGRVVGVGTLEGLGLERVMGVGWDGGSGLGVLAGEEEVIVFGAASVSSRNRCQVIARLKVAATSLCLRSQLGVLWIGDKQGTLWMVEWKDCNQHEIALSAQHRYPLFDQPISTLALSANAHLLFALSSAGTLATTQLEVAEQQSLPKQIRDHLFRLSELPARGMSHWLACHSQQEQLEREIIKLRGEEADLLGVRKSEGQQEERVQQKKTELQELYNKQIKEYEAVIGLPQLLRNVVQVRDELKVSERRRERIKDEVVEDHQNHLQQLFKQTQQLQQEFDLARVKCASQKEAFKRQLQLEKLSLVHEKNSTNGSHFHVDQTAAASKAQTQEQYHWTLEAAHQDHLIDLDTLQQEMGEEISQQTLSQQESLAIMRNRNIRTQLITNKITEMATQKQRLQCDLFLLQHEREEREKILEELAEENKESRMRYDRLVERAKHMQEQLINQRKLKDKCESTMEECTQQVSLLEQQLEMIEKKSLQINQQYLQQREELAYKQHTLQQLHAHANQLKLTRKHKQDAALLRKTQLQQAVSTLARKLAVDPNTTLHQLKEHGSNNCEKEDESGILGRQYVRQQQLHDKLAKDTGKWRQVKQSYMTGFTKNYHRLKEENLKLTYQYNDLLKVAQQYRTYTAHLQQKIINHQNQLPPTRNKPSSSLLHRQPHPNSRMRKPLVCLSLHQSSDNFITEI